MVSTQRLSPLAIWWLASRPRTWPAAIAPVAVGTALAFREGVFAPGPALAALLGALLLQIGANFANDYFDFQKGADTDDRVGPLRVTQAGLVTPTQIKAATAIAFALATVCGLYLTWAAGWPVVAVGLFSMVAALAYTGGPWPFGYHGLGEVVVFVFFGLIAVTGTYYVQAHTISMMAYWLAVPVGALAAAILVVNNLRDREGDALCGKRTLAVRWGVGPTRMLYATLIAAAYAVPVGVALSGRGPWAWLPLLTLPLAVPLLKAVFGAAEGPALNATLAGTARLMMASGSLLAIGLLA